MKAAVGTSKLTAWAAAIAAFSALNYYNHFVTDEGASGEPLYTWSYAVGGAVQFALFLGLVVLLARGESFREFLALGRPTSWWRAALIGVIAVALVLAASAVVQPISDPGEEQGLIPEEWDPSKAGPFAASFIVVAILAPIAEEFVFRGVGYTLLEPFGERWAIGVSAVAWALAHGLVGAFPIFVVFGIGLAYLRKRVDSIVPGVILHALFNGAILLAVVAGLAEGG